MNKVSDQSCANTEGLLLPGLDGTNPLGFLAALGVFRIIQADPDASSVRLCWVSHNGSWVPSLLTADTRHDFLNRLEDTLAERIDDHPIQVLWFKCDDTDSNGDARNRWFAEKTKAATLSDRVEIDWLASFRSDAVSDDATSQFQIVRRDYFQDNVASILVNTRREHLERTLFSVWSYSDPLANQSLHLDPIEDLRHAYRWHRPSGDPDRKKSGGMLGANRLALEALPLFPSIPNGEALRTTGFTGNRSDNTRWTWPIWSIPLSLSAVQSVLEIQELQEERLTLDQKTFLRHRGVAAVFRTHRILVEKTPNFTPARRIV